MLVYVGRISGRRYRTPLMIFSTRDGYVILIGYGVESNWPLACAFRRHERESLRRSRPCIVDAINTFRCKRRSNGAGQHYFGAMVSGSESVARTSSTSMCIPPRRGPGVDGLLTTT
jgi:hypothetical protein